MESKEKQQIIIISDIIKFWNFIEDIRNDVRITKNKEILVKGTIIAIYVPRKKE